MVWNHLQLCRTPTQCKFTHCQCKTTPVNVLQLIGKSLIILWKSQLYANILEIQNQILRKFIFPPAYMQITYCIYMQKTVIYMKKNNWKFGIKVAYSTCICKKYFSRVCSKYDRSRIKLLIPHKEFKCFTHSFTLTHLVNNSSLW